MIYVGTSGWQYDWWRGPFYPERLPKTRWLAHFSQRFPTVEVNNSFYRLPSEETFARWRAESAEAFVFALKASRFITHIKRLRDCREPVRLLWSRAQALGPKLGPILFQFPPRFPADPARLRAFLEVLPAGMRAAFEFRDPSWETGETYEILEEAGAAYVLADRPGARVAEVITANWSYVRFHQGSLWSPHYGREKLDRWATRIQKLPAKDIYVYFNNDAEAAAVRDARTLTTILARRKGKAVRTV